MWSEVRSYYGFTRDFAQAGYFETEQFQQLVKELIFETKAGKLIAVSGIVGCGKTTLLRRLQEMLAREKDFLVAKSLAVDKGQISLPVLINALFYDLGTTEKDFKIPTQPELRERVLRDLVKRRQKSVALFVDDAHDLQTKTLVGLKRLIEVVRDGGGHLSVVLAGHPKLKNDLRRPTMEEIGLRTAVFELTNFTFMEKLAYLKWLLTQCLPAKFELDAVITEEAVSLTAERLATPLQCEQYLLRAFEEGYKIGQKPVGTEVMQTVFAPDLEDLEPRLVRHGYNAKVLADLLNAKPREIKALLRGQLAAGRTQELQHEMLAIGIPL